jgi:iron complex outermembrane recepter protein
MMQKRSKALLAMSGVSALATAAVAQDQAPSTAAVRLTQTQASQDGSALMEDIIVTATKKGRGEQLQEVPASITAFGSSQLQALQFRNLNSLTTSMPNVALEEVGTQRGTANFSIRGLGVNSSVPSIEPTVGTFVNGIYMGTNYGVVLDAFDVDSVEVLRGPQGVLFGRNVTGGAISLNTRRPDGKTEVNGKASFETGLQQTYALGAQTAVVEDRLFARVAGYYSHDDGYFKDPTLGRDMGRTESWFVRPTLVAKPIDTVTMTLIGEYGQYNGDGPTVRNPAYISGFRTVQNFPGVTDMDYRSGVFETNIDTGFGNGTITNVMGYRHVDLLSSVDADAAPSDTYNIFYRFKQHQFSDELRYSGRFFDRADLVAGLFYFQQKFIYLVDDELYYARLGAAYGGRQRQHSFGIFANADIDIIPDRLVFTVGGRYSSDRKRVNIAIRNFAAPPCNFSTITCTFGFNDAKTFKTFSPKASLRWNAARGVQLYALYARGYRSGGYNVRAVTALVPPGPFNDEKTDDFEIGAKLDLFDRRLRLNLSAFHNTITGMQREQTQNLATGIQTIISNTADARLQGIEAELTAQIVKGLVLRGSIGIVDGDYKKIFADLNADGVINDIDKNLKIPRLSPVSYSLAVIVDIPAEGIGKFGGQISFDHKDLSYFNDRNTGPLPAFNNLSTTLSFSPAAMPDIRLAVFGRNLLNRDNLSANTPAGSLPTGGADQFIGKGRVLGGEIEFKF